MFELNLEILQNRIMNSIFYFEFSNDGLIKEKYSYIYIELTL